MSGRGGTLLHYHNAGERRMEMSMYESSRKQTKETRTISTSTLQLTVDHTQVLKGIPEHRRALPLHGNLPERLRNTAREAVSRFSPSSVMPLLVFQREVSIHGG